MALDLTKYPQFTPDDLFLIDRNNATFKITYADLAENLVFYFQGGGNNANTKLAINDLTDASTTKKRDPDNPTQAITGVNLSDTTNATSDGNQNWLLQYLPSEKEFVLSHPRDFLDQYLVLNNLGDVKTIESTDGSDAILNPLGSTTDPVLTQYETILVMSDKVKKLYQPANFSDLFNYAVDPDKGGNTINIKVDNLVDVNPGGTDSSGRLEINAAYNKKLPISATNPKYTYDAIPKKDDDILVYIKDPDETLTNPGGRTAGWYYATALFGEDLEIAGLPGNDDEAALAAGTTVTLGGVRVLEYMNTELEGDGKGGKKIKALATTPVPSNIGITSEGVLYSNIPDTLSFRSVVVIDDATVAGTETFVKLGGGVVPVADSGTSTKGGPGQYLTPEDATTDPEVGDFYVIKFERADDSNPAAITTKQLTWRDKDSIDGSTPVVENGDIVAWSGTRWAVIGTVNTDTIAQDLQSVTTRGRTTSESILVNLARTATPSVSDIGDGLIFVEGSTYDGNAEQAAPIPVAGDVIAKRVYANHIDFRGIPALPPG